MICGVATNATTSRASTDESAPRKYLRAAMDRANAISSAGSRYPDHPTITITSPTDPTSPLRIGAFGLELPPPLCAPTLRLFAALELDVAPRLFEDEPEPLALIICAEPAIVMTVAALRELSHSAVASPLHHKRRWVSSDLQPLALKLVGNVKSVAQVEALEGRTMMMFVVPPSPDVDGAAFVGRMELVADMNHALETHRIDRIAAELRKQCALNMVLADCLKSRPPPPASSRPLDAQLRVDVALRGENEVVFSVQEVASHLVSFVVRLVLDDHGGWSLAGTSDAALTEWLGLSLNLSLSSG